MMNIIPDDSKSWAVAYRGFESNRLERFITYSNCDHARNRAIQ